MKEQHLELYWSEIPIGKDNALSYDQLATMWEASHRYVRRILHELSSFDNGDDLILIRSSHGKGFYKTDDPKEIAAYRSECLNRGKRTFAPLRKIDRVLCPNDGQLCFSNNLKASRLACGMKQAEVVERMKVIDPAFDEAMLSRMENDRCLPTPLQLAHMASIYAIPAKNLVDMELYSDTIKSGNSGLQVAQNA